MPATDTPTDLPTVQTPADRPHVRLLLLACTDDQRHAIGKAFMAQGPAIHHSSERFAEGFRFYVMAEDSERAIGVMRDVMGLNR